MVKPKMFVSGSVDGQRVFLTSGFQAPSSAPLFEQIDVAAHFQSYATGGAILHLFTVENLSEKEQEDLIFRIFENFPVQYMTKTPFLTVCNECGHKAVGLHHVCPNCRGTDVTLYSRPIGYFRPVLRKEISADLSDARFKFWLDGRIEDFRTRYRVSKKDVESIVEELSSIS